MGVTAAGGDRAQSTTPLGRKTPQTVQRRAHSAVPAAKQVKKKEEKQESNTTQYALCQDDWSMKVVTDIEDVKRVLCVRDGKMRELL